MRRVLARLDPRVRDVTNLTRLSAGATNETWSVDAVRDAGVEPLILRRSAVGRGPGVLTLQAEAAVLSAVHGRGVPVPRVRHVLAPEDALGEGFLMQRIAGATLPGKILRDPALAPVLLVNRSSSTSPPTPPRLVPCTAGNHSVVSTDEARRLQRHDERRTDR